MSPKAGSDKIRVLIIDDIAETRENLRKLLSFETDIEVVGAAASGREGIELAKQYEPHIVLMDINMPGMDGITATEKILQEQPATQVVMLSVQGETDYLRRAMLAGARDFMTKPASGDELMSTIRRVYEMGKTQAARVAPAEPDVSVAAPVQQKRQRTGDVIAVFGPKGGVGCTTVAVNTAIALQQLMGHQQKIALMDAALQFGDVGVMLNIQTERSIADLTPRIDDLDSDVLSSVMSAHGSGLKVLLAPPRPEAAEGLLMNEGPGGNPALGAILDLVRENFDLVVVDMWSWIDDVALTIFDSAALIVLVVMPNIPAIKSARLFLEVASKLDYPMEKIVLAVNGVSRRGIQVSQIEKAMMPVSAKIPLDENAALTAANRGVPFVVKDRNRPVSQGVIQLAEVVHGKLAEIRGEGKAEEERAQEEPEAKGVGGTGFLRLKQAFER